MILLLTSLLIKKFVYDKKHTPHPSGFVGLSFAFAKKRTNS